MKYLVALVFIIMSGFCFGSDAYKWIDANGKMHYSDVPPKNGPYEKSERNNSVRDSKAGRDEESIRKIIESKKGKIYSLYNKRLKDVPGLAGKFTVRFAITENGKVTDIRIVTSDLNDSFLENQFIKVIEEIDFGYHAADVTKLSYSFDFIPQ